MKPKKLLSSFVFAAVMLVIMLPIVATAQEPTAAEPTPAEKFDYRTKDDGTFEITGLLDKGLNEIIIPETIDGKDVTSIGTWAFGWCTNLTSVTIPCSVETIGVSAFDGCTSLTSLTIPGIVKTIGEGAFCNCRDLTSVTIPGSVTTIEDYAFYECYALNNTYYLGTENDFGIIDIGVSNNNLKRNVTYIPITYTAPKDLVYDGNEKKAKVTANDDSLGDAKIEVKYRQGTVTTTEPPKNAGTYGVLITIDNLVTDLEIGNFTIKKASSVTTPTTKPITYGAKLNTVGLPDGWTWADGTTVPTVINNGYTAYLSPEDTDNYDWDKIDGWNATEKRVERTVAVTVNKAQVEKPAENTTVFIYDKKEQTYTLTESELYEINNNKRTEAGSQDVTVALKDKDNYEWKDGTTENLTYTFTVNEATITPTITLTAPERSGTPQTSIEAEEYTATVVWLPEVAQGGTFAKRTVYTATITITPKDNYTVDGISENGYTLDGAESVTNQENSNVVTAVFPRTLGSSGGSSTPRYTVEFETDGGSAVESQTLLSNRTVTEPKNPTKDGYIFDGWYADGKFENKFDFDTRVTKNITLYAKWTKAEEPSDEKKDDKEEDNEDGKKDDNDTENKEPIEETWKNPFEDVKENDWFFEDVKYAVKNGLFKGMTATTFAPAENVTRGMFVTVLYRAEGEPAVNKSRPFADVTAADYYCNAVIWAQQTGIIKGISKTEFAPNEKITREQIAAIMHRYAKYKGYDVTVGESTNILSYTDFEEISEYAIEAMQYAVGSGLMKGKTESTLNPQDNATRAEIAAILQRFIEGNK